MDLFLPFGLRSLPALFNQSVDALEFCMRLEKRRNLLHYLYNYFTVGPAGSTTCQENIDTMVWVCQDLGFLVNPKKVMKET